jgi:hypothetical protein
MLPHSPSHGEGERPAAAGGFYGSGIAKMRRIAAKRDGDAPVLSAGE